MDEVDEEEMMRVLGLHTEARPDSTFTPIQERVLAGFEDINNFYRDHGRVPVHGNDKDIFERLYAVRLDKICQLDEFHKMLMHYDKYGILKNLINSSTTSKVGPSEEEMMSTLGLDQDNKNELTNLQHVRPYAEINAAEEIARRSQCKEFKKFEPLFIRVQKELDEGIRKARRFKNDGEIKAGEYFILGGLKAYVDSIGEEFLTEQDRPNARLRVIFDNGTENNFLLRSFQRALYKDDAGRRISDPEIGPLFNHSDSPEGEETGTIYILRSKSEHPLIAEYKDVLHKIGVTGSDVQARIAQAKIDPTFLLAEVEIVATYKLININRTRLENLLHRFFSNARLDLEIHDRFGNPVKPREWFLVPIDVIDEVVHKLKDNSLIQYHYNRNTAKLEPN